MVSHGDRRENNRLSDLGVPDDPNLEARARWSPLGKAYPSIGLAVARGDMTTEDAIAAYRRLAEPQ